MPYDAVTAEYAMHLQVKLISVLGIIHSRAFHCPESESVSHFWHMGRLTASAYIIITAFLSDHEPTHRHTYTHVHTHRDTHTYTHIHTHTLAFRWYGKFNVIY